MYVHFSCVVFDLAEQGNQCHRYSSGRWHIPRSDKTPKLVLNFYEPAGAKKIGTFSLKLTPNCLPRAR